MAVIKCKMCGGDLILTEGSSVAECEYCGSRQTVPAADNEKKLGLFGRANRLRAACDFDKAAGIYEAIIADFPEEPEAYWGLVLCKYGIEYVDDPGTGKKIPTCHRSSFDSVMDDSNYEQALENADIVARRVYREEAVHIEQIRKDILEVSEKEPPYDIFICYKETDENGSRTVDSVMAQDIYDMLCAKDYRVFFARITLEDKLGCAYEPFIFSALNSAKIMLVVGTDIEYLDAVWVKNEWSRFLKLMEKDKSKHLIPCYKGIDPNYMPKEFKHLQAQDMGKVGADQDLMRGIEKLLPKTEKVVVPAANPGVDQIRPQLQRGVMALEDGEWRKANEFFENVLNLDPQNAYAYFGKLMIEFKLHKEEELGLLMTPLNTSKNYEKVLRFGDEQLRHRLVSYHNEVTQRIENYNNKKQNLQDKKNRVILEVNQSEQKCQQAKQHCEEISVRIRSKNSNASDLSEKLARSRQAVVEAKSIPAKGRVRVVFYAIVTIALALMLMTIVPAQCFEDSFQNDQASFFFLLALPHFWMWMVKDIENGHGFWGVFFRAIWIAIRAALSFIANLIVLLIFAGILQSMLSTDSDLLELVLTLIVMALPLLYAIIRIAKIRKELRERKRLIRWAERGVTAAEMDYRKATSNDPELEQLNKSLEEARAALAQTELDCKARIREVNEEYIADAKRDGFAHEDLVPAEFK